MIEVQLHPGMLIKCLIIAVLLGVIIWRLKLQYDKSEEIRLLLSSIKNRL